MMCGGLRDFELDGTQKTELSKVVTDHLVSLGKSSGNIEIIECKTQIVAGTNYFVKVMINGDSCVHVRIFKGLPCNGGEYQVHGLVEKSKDAPLEHFQ